MFFSRNADNPEEAKRLRHFSQMVYVKKLRKNLERVSLAAPAVKKILMSKYVCGKCHQGFNDLKVFGDHPCAGDNPMLAALGKVIHLGEYSIDFSKTVEEEVEKHKVRSAVDRIEDGLKRGDLSA